MGKSGDRVGKSDGGVGKVRRPSEKVRCERWEKSDGSRIECGQRAIKERSKSDESPMAGASLVLPW